jgi:hypothetical protein
MLKCDRVNVRGYVQFCYYCKKIARTWKVEKIVELLRMSVLASNNYRWLKEKSQSAAISQPQVRSWPIWLGILCVLLAFSPEATASITVMPNLLDPVPSTLTFQLDPVFSTLRQCFVVYPQVKGFSNPCAKESTTQSVSMLIGDWRFPSVATGNSLCHSEGPERHSECM